MNDNTPQDVLIMVTGLSGSGKSSFIQSLVADDNVEIGHDLLSCTSKVSFFPLQHHSGCRVFLVDTPGFDDTYKSDGEILQSLAFVLAQTYSQRLFVAGVIYTHPITTIRLGGRATRSLEILKRLCGEQAYSRIIFITTMWNISERDPNILRDAVKREKALSNSKVAWGALCDKGANVMRWKSMQNGSSMSIIDHVINTYWREGPIVLSLQQQLVDEGRILSKTDVGVAINQAIRNALASQHKEERELEVELQRGKYDVEDHENSRQALSKALETVEALLQSQKKLLADFRELAKQETPAYAEALKDIQTDDGKRSTLTKEGNDTAMLGQKTTPKVQEGSAKNRISNRLFSNSQETLINIADDEYGTRVSRKYGSSSSFNTGRASVKQTVTPSRSQERLKKRQVLQKNLVPLLEILVGIGIAGAGAAVPPMIGPGIAAVVAGISGLDFSRKKDKDGDDGILGRYKRQKNEKHADHDGDGLDFQDS
ncbi:hypothetical protein PFICI_05459 [Pestalotiopsis fici W106-1]|uniref:G domain-containing protein n=1 Tax=Pestalotiopsis fici (strain W106-1 / CGMCC3.15140) TaxID=1229662 RepID=W3XBX1_PESFW|nr:uncharacterized protein PFICI_05459 [Pestalotiopsis fici W106-1]ETS83583.1 hypothetical protein PFICI_05459 [Pestalotiopsis fici W106-1]